MIVPICTIQLFTQCRVNGYFNPYLVGFYNCLTKLIILLSQLDNFLFYDLELKDAPHHDFFRFRNSQFSDGVKSFFYSWINSHFDITSCKEF